MQNSFESSRFDIRPATREDAQDLYRLARILNSSNLPSDEDAVESLIDKSEGSFANKLNKFEREYVFVLEDLKAKKVIGTGQVIAQHGTKENPHVFLELNYLNSEPHSLEIKREYEGPSELGGLILDPEYRKIRIKNRKNTKQEISLGRLLSFARLEFIKNNKHLFHEKVFADLLPPLTNLGKSMFWEELGQNFTHKDYFEANRLARSNRNFIYEAFPKTPIYLSDLSPEVVRQIGVPGVYTMPAAKLLESAGFSFRGQLNPFDAGPHYEARVEDILSIPTT